MLYAKPFIAALTLVALAGCLDTDAERAVAGAAAGALIADEVGLSRTQGALIAGAAGVFCDDAGVCR